MVVDINKFESKFKGWWRFMSPFVGSEKMYNIYQKLKDYKNRGITIFPYSNNTFKAFEMCSPKELKVILIGMEPYSGVYSNGLPQATGLSFDCSNSPEGICQPSLITFHSGIANEYNIETDCENNLSYLCSQGVMLLNRSLTVGYKRIGDHICWWDDFMQYFLGVVNDYFSGIPIVLLGKDAQYLEKWIRPLNNPLYKLEHPSKAARENRIWSTNGTFKLINEYLYSHNKESICWHSKLYKEELPF